MRTQGGNLSGRADKRFILNRFRYILRELRGYTGNVLVIGSGDGTFERLLKQQNPSVCITSVELNESFRESLAEWVDTVIIDDFLHHEFNAQYAVIVSVDVIEHIIDTDRFMRKTRALLADNGVLYLQTPNLASWHGRLCLLLGYLPAAMEVSTEKNYFGKWFIFRDDEPVNHIHVFTYRALREFCAFHGFEILECIGIDHSIPWLFNRFPSLAGSVCLKLRIINETDIPEID